MKREDLRKNIIPTILKNTNENQEEGNKKFDTIDYIYLDSYDDQFWGQLDDLDRRVSATDYALDTNCYSSKNYQTKAGKNSCLAWLRTA